MRLIFLVFALLAGTLLPTQAGINAQLAKQLGNPLLAATISFLLGTLALLLFTAMSHPSLPTFERLIQIPWYLWLGGLLGVMYLTATIILAPLLGAASMIGLIITGQMLAAIALDHFGLVGFPIHPLSSWRAIGGVLLVAGVILVQRT
ncbi:MAG: DMT family transporter [Scytolyngbya sp. HA4215-MV1]|jgi:transporter family-2 protein|nr:DMT family transporter [Scytolyngbya sp. HA4215-MV1]